MTSRRKKNVDKSSDFESFMRQTADYLPPAMAPDKQDSKQPTSLSALFSETKPKEKIVNTTLQLPQSVNKRLKKLCQKLGKSKNEVLLTLIEALLEEKGL